MPTWADRPERTEAPPTVNMRPGADADSYASTDFELVSETPDSLGDYELMYEIGAGGMGQVYNARQKSLGRIVALKTLRPRDYSEPVMVQRLHKEAEAAAQLDHPGIVPVYGVHESDGQLFYTMAYIDGRGLDDRLRHGPLDNRMAAYIVQQVAEAVAYAHRKGVVHRDLKPGNILLARDGGVKITDFGIARRLNVKDLDSVEPAIQVGHPSSVGTVIKLTQAGTVLGTPGFMAPEQATATTHVGPPADVWALGAILYACLTGRSPFVGATAIETLALTVDTEPVPPDEINPDADPELVAICLKCLQKDTHDRYPSAEAVGTDLALWRQEQTEQSPRSILWSRIARYWDDMPELIPLAAGLTVYRLANLQEAIFIGAAVAGVGLSVRRRDVGLLVIPLIAMVVLFAAFPTARLVSSNEPAFAGGVVSVAGLIATAALLACGLIGLPASRPGRISWRLAAGLFLTAGMMLVLAAIVAYVAVAQNGPEWGGASMAMAIERFFERIAACLLAIPIGLAAGVLLGQLKHRLDRFGSEPIPAFELGAAIMAVVVAAALFESQPALIAESSRFGVLGPGPALTGAEARAAAWMSRTNSMVAVDVRLAAAGGIFFLKLTFFVVPMVLGGVVASLISRVILWRNR